MKLPTAEIATCFFITFVLDYLSDLIQSFSEGECTAFFCSKKILPSFWLTIRGVVYYSLLPDEQTITADLFIENIPEMERKLFYKYPRFGAVVC